MERNRDVDELGKSSLSGSVGEDTSPKARLRCFSIKGGREGGAFSFNTTPDDAESHAMPCRAIPWPSLLA